MTRMLVFRYPMRHSLPLVCLALAGCSSSSYRPPSANAGADQIVDASTTVTLDGSKSESPEHRSLTFAWSQLSGVPVTLSSDHAAVVTFQAPDDGSALAFSLVVSDGVVKSTAVTHVSVHPLETSARITELVQHIPKDPAVVGHAPSGWQVPSVNAPEAEDGDAELDEFSEGYGEHTQLFAPVTEAVLAAGATRRATIELSGIAGLQGAASWVGTTKPLDVVLALDGEPLATGSAYHFGSDRGGVTLVAQSPGPGVATLSVTNSAGKSVNVRLAFAAGAP